MLGVLNNISSIYAQNNLNNTQNSLETVLNQLSSGMRINSGADDAAGLALADGLEANVSELTQSAQNASQGVGYLQTADGALSQVNAMMNRAVTLATESANGTLNSGAVDLRPTRNTSRSWVRSRTLARTLQYNGINVSLAEASASLPTAPRIRSRSAHPFGVRRWAMQTER